MEDFMIDPLYIHTLENILLEKYPKVTLTEEAMITKPLSHVGGAENKPGVPRRQRRNRMSARFKTQPITFSEITEVDEESNPTGNTAGGGAAAANTSVIPKTAVTDAIPKSPISPLKANKEATASSEDLAQNRRERAAVRRRQQQHRGLVEAIFPSNNADAASRPFSAFVLDKDSPDSRPGVLQE